MTEKKEKFYKGETVNSDDMTYKQLVAVFGEPLAKNIWKERGKKKEVVIVYVTRVDHKTKTVTISGKKNG